MTVHESDQKINFCCRYLYGDQSRHNLSRNKKKHVHTCKVIKTYAKTNIVSTCKVIKKPKQNKNPPKTFLYPPPKKKFQKTTTKKPQTNKKQKGFSNEIRK